MQGVHPDMIVGVNTECIAGEGKIVTAGGQDVHVHYICPELCRQALGTGITTLIGGGTGGPAAGTTATTCTSGSNHLKNLFAATDGIALNFAFTGKGNEWVKPIIKYFSFYLIISIKKFGTWWYRRHY